MQWTFAIGISLGLAAIGMKPAAADALENIAKAGVLKVGIFEDFPPFASLGSSMKIEGYDVDMAEKLAAALGVKAELVGITGQNRIPQLSEGKVDILLSIGFSDERAQVVDFTKPYAPYYIAVMGPKEIEVKGPADLAGKTIAVNRGTLEDTEVTKLSDAGRAGLRRDRIGLVFQQYNLIPSLSVGDNLVFQARIAGRYDAAWYKELIERLGLGGLLKRYPEQLSGGQQQRVAIGRALATKPSLLLADEPTGNLDEATAEDVLALTRDLVTRTGCGFLMVTHSLHLAATLDRHVNLHAGRIA
jgi:putative ABC transport system ATP-binding protein